jgi:hypothetical protein
LNPLSACGALEAGFALGTVQELDSATNESRQLIADLTTETVASVTGFALLSTLYLSQAIL